MRSHRTLLALLLLAATGGCYYGSNYPNVGAWNGAAVEQPQRVRFFYGYVVDVRAVPVVYETRPRFANWELPGRELVELSPNLGDGLRDQAAAVWDCEDAGLAATSIPSVNLTP